MNYPTYRSKYPELAFYGLPGHTRQPADILQQARDAEALGIGGIMVSERMDYKEISAICGAVAAVTQEIYISTSGTNQNTRHPVVTAAMCSTLNRLSEGRFALGLAKGVMARWKVWGLDFPNYQRTEDFVKILRTLWAGEPVVDYAGALGTHAHLHQADYIDEDIPVFYVGFGPKSVEHAGGVFDGVHLHTFMSDQALTNAVAQARAGEERAGRTVGSTKIWSVFATACDVSDEVYLKYIIARLATYLQIPGYGEMLVQVNDWDLDALRKFRTDPAVTGVGGLIDSVASNNQLGAIERLIPEAWRPAAVGDAKQCARRWVDQFDAGADGIIIHASTPEEFAPVLAEYDKIRPTQRFTQRTNRPG